MSALGGSGRAARKEEGRVGPARDRASAFGTGHHGAHHTRLAGFHSKSSACRCLDMPSQFIQGLVAELDGAEADRPVALGFARMQLPQRDHGLAVALLIERNRGAKTGWIVIHVRTVINLDQARGLDPPKAHSVRNSPAVVGATAL